MHSRSILLGLGLGALAGLSSGERIAFLEVVAVISAAPWLRQDV